MMTGDRARRIAESDVTLVKMVDNDVRIEPGAGLVKSYERSTLDVSVLGRCGGAKGRVLAGFSWGVCERVIEGALAGGAGQRFEQRGCRGRIADAAERF